MLKNFTQLSDKTILASEFLLNKFKYLAHRKKIFAVSSISLLCPLLTQSFDNLTQHELAVEVSLGP